jgi:hypothetical protein
MNKAIKIWAHEMEIFHLRVEITHYHLDVRGLQDYQNKTKHILFLGQNEEKNNGKNAARKSVGVLYLGGY